MNGRLFLSNTPKLDLRAGMTRPGDSGVTKHPHLPDMDLREYANLPGILSWQTAKIVGLFMLHAIILICAIGIAVTVLTWFFGGGWILIVFFFLVLIQLS